MSYFVVFLNKKRSKSKKEILKKSTQIQITQLIKFLNFTCSYEQRELFYLTVSFTFIKWVRNGIKFAIARFRRSFINWNYFSIRPHFFFSSNHRSISQIHSIKKLPPRSISKTRPLSLARQVIFHFHWLPLTFISSKTIYNHKIPTVIKPTPRGFIYLI